MFQITRTLRGLLLLVVLIYLPVCSGWDVYADRLFLKPVMFEKSCRNGMVANQDYFLLKGLINISNIDGAQNGQFSIYYIDKFWQSNKWIFESTVGLMEATCKDTNIVKINSCSCTFKDSKYVRLMCNLTAKRHYSLTYLCLRFAHRGKHYYSPGFQMPPVYDTPVCIAPSVNRAAKSHPGRFSAVIGTALLGTAVVCLIPSIIFQLLCT